MAERSVEIRQFKGLNDYAIPDNDPSVTRSLEAVITRNGRILGVPGMDEYDHISTAASATIIKLMPFYTSNLASTLYRMLPTKVEQHNIATHVWDDVTGTALNGFAYNIPQFVVHKDTLVFTNEGNDRLRKLTGSGNSAELGGTPPYCKALWQAWGFLFAGNVSTDGSTWDPRGVLYSDDFDNNWDLCNGNTLAFNETNGEIVVGAPVGTLVVVGKTDAIMWINFHGGLVRFTQDRVPNSQGVLAPASFKVLDDLAVAVYLATDLRLQFCNGHKVDVVPSYVQRKLDETMDPENARWAVGEAYPDKDIYSLFYTAKGDDGNMNQIMLNFRTGEFNHRVYPGHAFNTAALIRRGTQNRFLLATDDLVFEEAQEFPTMNGSRIERYYDIDWTSLGLPGEKYLKGIEFSTVKKPGGRIAVSVAADHRDVFEFEKFYTLKNIPSAGEYAKIIYRIDPGLRGREHKIRIRLFHDESGAPVEIIPPARIVYEPLSDNGTSLEQNSTRAPANTTA